MRFRKKPLEVSAEQWRGSNLANMTRFVGEGGRLEQYSQKLKLWAGGTVHTIHPGDWVIRGVEDEIYPCPQTVFAKTYERS